MCIVSPKATRNYVKICDLTQLRNYACYVQWPDVGPSPAAFPKSGRQVVGNGGTFRPTYS